MLVEDNKIWNICLIIAAIVYCFSLFYKLKRENHFHLFFAVIIAGYNFAVYFMTTAFFLYMTIYFFGSILIIIESEEKHPSYMYFGAGEEYQYKLEPRHVHVLNKMEETILVYSLPSDNGLTEDWEVLAPGDIAQLHSGIHYYFEDHPSFYHGKSLRNAVDYYNHPKLTAADDTSEAFSHEKGAGVITSIDTKLSPDGQTVTIQYQLRSNSNITFYACDITGSILGSIMYQNREAGEWQETLLLTRQPIGNTLTLTVRCGKEQFSLKVSKK